MGAATAYHGEMGEEFAARVKEPRATEEAWAVDPRRYERTHRTPTFLAVRLRRP
ncbi:hypothetical protein [Streptomyces sp. NBC_01334]|uniref:hypothetical protein n=1 Tax=Streptomyces sp. NBC_01334 TaxID=2903827 RepID=UPI002E0D4CDD|nr:hypothetical protein OG736_04875 [Streptomyces sp. NBC_01334]